MEDGGLHGFEGNAVVGWKAIAFDRSDPTHDDEAVMNGAPGAVFCKACSDTLKVENAMVRGAWMRTPVNAFYYPDMISSDLTLKKAILFFDELHFVDRASYSFGGGGQGQIMTIACASPLRSYEASLRENGVPLYVHKAPSGPLPSQMLEDVAADINDSEFLSRFQKGLGTSVTFRDIEVTPGNYGDSGMQEDLVKTLLALDLVEGLKEHENAMALLIDGTVQPFRTRTAIEKARVLIHSAARCSLNMNVALHASSRNGMTPFADASPFGELLGTKYQRAIAALHKSAPSVQLTDLSFNVFDELIPSEVLMKMSFSEVVRYRTESTKAREEFLEYLSVLQVKQGAIKPDEDYNAAVSKMVMTEIVPAARAYRQKLQGIGETFLGSLAKSAWAAVGTVPVGAVGLTLFGALSWPHLLALAGPAAAVAGNAAIDALIASRSAARECAISYVLDLDS
ncbi:MAG: hypothetical protein ABSG84_04115 [Acidobacteriaceae bacterium]|jgi:hypothetical protein